MAICSRCHLHLYGFSSQHNAQPIIPPARLWRPVNSNVKPHKNMIKARWIAFLVLLPIAEFSVSLALPISKLLHTFCPQGFWRKPLLFGSNYCGYAPISILTAAIEFGGLIVVSLLCVLVIPQRSRFHAVRVLLLAWLCVPVATGIWRGVSWSTLAEFTVSLLFWLGLSVVALLWPGHSLGADTQQQEAASRQLFRAGQRQP